MNYIGFDEDSHAFTTPQFCETKVKIEDIWDYLTFTTLDLFNEHTAEYEKSSTHFLIERCLKYTPVLYIELTVGTKKVPIKIIMGGNHLILHFTINSEDYNLCFNIIN